MTLTNYQKKLRDLETGELNPSDFDHMDHMDHVGVAVEALKNTNSSRPFPDLQRVCRH